MTPQELKEIEARANEATEGPWGQHDYDNDHCMITAGVDGNGAYIYVADVWDERDIPFIAHARSDIPNLLAYIAALTEKLRAVEAERDRYKTRAQVAESSINRAMGAAHDSMPEYPWNTMRKGEELATACWAWASTLKGTRQACSDLRAELERKDAALKVIAESDEWSGGLSNTSHQERARAALQPKEPPCKA